MKSHRAKRHPWDLLAVAPNPNLSEPQARAVFQCLARIAIRRRLGEFRCTRAREQMISLYRAQLGTSIYVDPLSLAGGFTLHVRTLVKNAFLPGVRVATAITGPPGDRDATELTPLLGENPQAWEYFITLLDSADPLADVMSVVTAAARLAATTKVPC